MSGKASFLAAALLFLSVTGFAQDPLKVAPQAYKLGFENDWVKVTRVRYGPKEKIPEHDHTETGAAYVYLNDSGPVIFRHVGLSYGAVTRPEVKAGSFRLYKAVKETHEVENPNETPSDFLRVEFKTAQDGAKPLRGKFHREAYPAGENFQKVQFENEQVRVTRLACAKTCEVPAGAAEPALIVALTAGRFASSRIEPGDTRWIAPGQKEAVSNAGGGHVEFLRFELKGKPLKAAAEKDKPHAHPDR